MTFTFECVESSNEDGVRYFCRVGSGIQYLSTDLPKSLVDARGGLGRLMEAMRGDLESILPAPEARQAKERPCNEK